MSMENVTGYDSDTEASYSEYKRSLRGRAHATINELQRSLRSNPSVHPRQRSRRSRSASPSSQASRSVSPRTSISPRVQRTYTSRTRYEESGSWGAYQVPTEHSDHTYGAAVNRLRNLIDSYESRPLPPKTVQFNSSRYGTYTYNAPGMSRGLRGEIPGPEEVVPLLQNQSSVVTKLEAENQYLREELQTLKMKVKEVIEENRLLHEELKKSAVHEILKSGLSVEGIQSSDDTGFGSLSGFGVDTIKATLEKPPTKEEYSIWHKEIGKINTLHSVKAGRLEAQLNLAREEISRYEKELEELKGQVRLQKAYNSVDQNTAVMASGLCARCGLNEAVLPTNYSTQTNANAKLIKERDELMNKVTSMKTQMESMKQREEQFYLQVKCSVEMVEQSQLEKMEALVHCMQLEEEQAEMRDRIDKHTQEMSAKMSQERELVRSETKKKKVPTATLR